MYKRVSLFVSMILTLLMLQGCANNVKTKTFKGQISGVNVSQTFVYAGDRVLSVSMTQNIPYSYLNVSSRTEAEQMKLSEIQKANSWPGVTYKVRFFATWCEEVLVIDFSTASPNIVNRFLPNQDITSQQNFISMSATQSNYLRDGNLVLVHSTD